MSREGHRLFSWGGRIHVPEVLGESSRYTKGVFLNQDIAMSLQYQTFVLDEHNRWGVNDPLFYIWVQEHESDEARVKFIQDCGRSRCFGTYADAVSALKGCLARRREHLEKQMARLDYNETHFETLYPLPQDLTAVLEGEYDKLVAGLRQLVDQPGDFQLGVLRVTNNYLSQNDSELFIFDLPQWGFTPQTFSTTMCAVIDRAMWDAGLAMYSEWNGRGCFTWSRRARKVIQNAA